MDSHDGKDGRLIFPLFLTIVVGIFSACNDNTIVGSELSPDPVTVGADTIYLSDVSVVRSPAFSGNLPHVTAGAVEDPIFGSISATALIRPVLSREVGVDTIGENAVARLNLNIMELYGPEDKPVEFEIIETARRWRGSSWRYDSIPDLKHPNVVVGSFQVTGADSVSVRLSDEWTKRYREIFLLRESDYRDSLYLADLPGLAIVPVNSDSRLVFMEAGRITISFTADDGTRDLSRGLASWAVSMEHNPPDGSLTGTSLPVDNFFGHIICLDVPFTEDFLGSRNLSRLELVLYEDTLRLNMQDPPGFERPRPENVRMYYLNEDQINYAILGDPRLQTSKRSEDNSFRLPLTSLANERLHRSPDTTRKLYLTTGANDGRIIPAMITGPDDPARPPKLLVTSVSR